ncbi:MAG: PilT/PilU family type 4a pilus ATPase [Clostridium sp.]|nr:PilT/PilU family type 4a pilus ATPase [Clostridium sp.]
MEAVNLLEDLLIQAVKIRASDLHVKADSIPMFRVDGELLSVGEKTISSDEIKIMLSNILKEKVEEYNLCGEYDIGYELKEIGRFRVNAFKSRGKDSISIRVVNEKIISLDELCMFNTIRNFTKESSGLILISGATGSGKSTTIASMLEEINETRACHIITLEEPIEYIYKDKKSIISQREIGKDTKGYEEGIKAALREDPDVIFIGEMRDINTIKIAITAAETGHLVLSTLHAVGACEAISRVINVFPKEQQEEIKMELSLVLKGIVWQKLIKKKGDKGRCAAMEIMNVTPAIKNLIREGKVYQIKSSIEIGGKYGMVTIERFVTELYRRGVIDEKQTKINSYATNDV